MAKRTVSKNVIAAAKKITVQKEAKTNKIRKAAGLPPIKKK